MNVECGDCNHHFVLSPNDITGVVACPDCGGKRMFRNQPSPTQSDGTLRDMVDSDSQKDQGGNPLGEGTIMGNDGEKPIAYRDNFMHGKVAEYYPGEEQRRMVEDHPATCPKCRATAVDPHHGECLNCGYTIPWDGGEWMDMPGADRMMDSEYQKSGDGHNWLNPSIITQLPLGPTHHGKISELVTTPGQKPITDGPSQELQYPTQSMDDIVGVDAPQEQQSHLNWTPGMHGRGLVIAGEPHTWNTMDPNNLDPNNLGMFHKEYAESQGVPDSMINNPQFIDFGRHSVEIEPDGSIKTPNRDVAPFIQADPRLNHVEAPEFNFSKVQVSRTNNMEPYLPWTHEADVLFNKGPDENLPQHSALATPHPVSGIHNGHLNGMIKFLGAHINGLNPLIPQDQEEIYRQHAGPGRGPVTVSVHHPGHLAAAVSAIEDPAIGPTPPAFKEAYEKIRLGQVPAPEHVDPTMLPPLAQPQAPIQASVYTAAFAALPLVGPALEAAGITGLGDIAGPVMERTLGGEGANILGDLTGMGGGGQQQQQPQQAPYQSPLNPMSQLGAVGALVLSDYETPASNPDVGVKHDDPEDVDTHEFNDRDHNPNPNNPNIEDSGASGEDEVRDQAGFGPNSEGVERMGMLLPLLMKYYHSNESGAKDPIGCCAILRAVGPARRPEPPIRPWADPGLQRPALAG